MVRRPGVVNFSHSVASFKIIGGQQVYKPTLISVQKRIVI